MSQGNSGVRKVKWYRSLSFLGLIGLTLIPLWDMAGIFVIMNTKGRDLVVKESSRLIEELGNTAIAEIGKRSRQIGALSRSVAIMGESMPKDDRIVQSILPNVLDFHGDMDVAGGGIWPEPYAFHPGKEKYSFFYGRDESGKLKFYDDYNSGRGYHQDEWYPVVKYSKGGSCFWSRSYMDPYSYQPMVTCTVAMRRGEKFIGVSTVDLKLEGLHDFMERIRTKTGGYVFLLDRNNKFLTFPFPEKVKLVETDDKGNRTEEFMTAERFAQDEPLFAPIASAVERMNEFILDSAQKMDHYRPGIVDQIDADSDQINREEAEFIAAVIADPLGTDDRKSNLYEQFSIPDDFITNEESLVFVFHVPESYWKVVAVKPMSEAQAVASAISNVLMSLIAVTILVGVLLAAVLLHYFFTKPIKETTQAVEAVGELVAAKDFSRLKEHRIENPAENELGRLATIINSLGSELQQSYTSLLDLNTNLEKKVEKRTAEIRKTLDEIRELKYRQDGDYYLTSQLLKPLSGNYSENDAVSVEFVVSQNKKFEFKKWKEEIGGDICISHDIELRDRPLTILLNADAMGKSIQGAGGILVLGSIFSATIERTRLSGPVQALSPERWLKNAFVEMQKVFEAFDGSMLISVFLAAVDQATGTMYYINAEHPPAVLYRDGRAAFAEEGRPLRKLGVVLGEAGSLQIQVLRLQSGDVLYLGSDGRDDLEIGTDEKGHRIINEDETLFLRHVERGGGRLQDVLTEIYNTGRLADDLSLMRVEFAGDTLAVSPRTREFLEEARELTGKGRHRDALYRLEAAVAGGESNPLIDRALARVHYKLGDFRRAANHADRYLVAHPHDTRFLFFASIVMFKAGRLEEAVDLGERGRMRRPGERNNLLNLATIYEKQGNPRRAETMRAEAEVLAADE